MQDDQIWAGHAHLGDEPGVFGDANYVGLSIEFPLTINAREPVVEEPSIEVVAMVDRVQMDPGYDGHLLVLVAYEPDEHGLYTERILGSKRITESGLTSMYFAPEPGSSMPTNVSVGVRVDTSRRPGLFDDFVLRELHVRSMSHRASLGFA